MGMIGDVLFRQEVAALAEDLGIELDTEHAAVERGPLCALPSLNRIQEAGLIF